jgi:hypothetical protein
MKLDDLLGAGAFDKLTQALTFPSRAMPLIIEGEWDPATVNSEWPTPGQWCLVSVMWKDTPEHANSNLRLYFKDRVMYWGVGICDILQSYDLLKDFPETTMWSFLNEFQIEQMKVDVPVEFSTPFVKIGFEHSSIPETWIAQIGANCRIQQWVEWVNAGSDPSTEPEWRK